MRISRKQIYNEVLEAKNKFGYGLPSPLPYSASEGWINSLQESWNTYIQLVFSKDINRKYNTELFFKEVTFFEGVVLAMGISASSPIELYDNEDYYIDEDGYLDLKDDAKPRFAILEDGTPECQVLYDLPKTTEAMEECEKLLVALGVKIC